MSRLFPGVVQIKRWLTTKEHRIAFVGDIHSNWEALEAVLSDIHNQGVPRIGCTGDIVGYGADPSKCVTEIRKLDCPVVIGNHDFYAATDVDLSDVTAYARGAVLWTRQQLSSDDKQWLISCPKQMNVDGRFGLVHSSWLEPDRWRYVLKPEQAKVNLSVQQTDVVFFGHTHIPGVFSLNLKNDRVEHSGAIREGTFLLKSERKHLINPGSVGQPRDRDPRAAYAVYDSVAQTVEIRRVEYDIETARQKIKDAGLDMHIADRLSIGR